MSDEKVTEEIQSFGSNIHELPKDWVAPFMPLPSREHRPAGGEVAPPDGVRASHH